MNVCAPYFLAASQFSKQIIIGSPEDTAKAWGPGFRVRPSGPEPGQVALSEARGP